MSLNCFFRSRLYFPAASLPSLRMYITNCQRSVSVNWSFHDGIGPRPSLIFQKSDPSVSLLISFGSVKFAGFTLTNFPAAPSPAPVFPWQGAQFSLNTFDPAAILVEFAETGFFTLLAASGATHGSSSSAAEMGPANTNSATTVKIPQARTKDNKPWFIRGIIAIAPSKHLGRKNLQCRAGYFSGPARPSLAMC